LALWFARNLKLKANGVNDRPSQAGRRSKPQFLLELIIENTICGEELANASFVDISGFASSLESLHLTANL
jgi:hypothetical protein